LLSALLEAGVVVGADAGEDSDFLASEAGDAPAAATGETNLRGLGAGSLRPQEHSERTEN
jgi:hypothetical protein